MKTEQEYETLVKQATFRILKVLDVFKDEPAHIKKQLARVLLRKIISTLDGPQVFLIVEGHGLVTEIKEPGQADPINTAKTDQGGGDQTV